MREARGGRSRHWPADSCPGLADDDPVGREVRVGRIQAYQALIEAIKDDDSPAGKMLRKEYGAVVELNTEHEDTAIDDVPGGPVRLRAIAVARQRVVKLRSEDVIGDDAYRVLMQELDWADLSAGGGWHEA
jgi:hypothetical protein